MTSPLEVEDEALESYYFEQGTRFFLLLALVQAWTIGLDVVFNTITVATYLTAGIGLLLLWLMVSRNHRLHVTGLVVMLLAFLVRSVLQAMAG